MALTFRNDGDLPDGISLNTGTGVYSGTLSLVSSGVHNMITTAINADGEASDSWIWTVNEVAKAPVQQTLYPDRVNTVNSALSVDLGSPYWTSNAGAITYTLAPTSGPLPTDLGLLPDGIVAGTPSATGVFADIIIRATNSIGSTDSNAFDWTIVEFDPGQPPIFSGPVPDQTDVENSIIVGRDLSIYWDNWSRIEFTGLPDGLSDNGAGIVSGNPTIHGIYYVQMTAYSNGLSANSNIFRWEITPDLPQGGTAIRVINQGVLR